MKIGIGYRPRETLVPILLLSLINCNPGQITENLSELWFPHTQYKNKNIYLAGRKTVKMK